MQKGRVLEKGKMVGWSMKTLKWVRTVWEIWFFECLLKRKTMSCKDSTGKMSDSMVAWEVRKRESVMCCAQWSLQEKRRTWRNGHVKKCDKQRNSWTWIFGNHGILSSEMKKTSSLAKMAQPQPAEVDKQ